jgi:hypothetical protein
LLDLGLKAECLSLRTLGSHAIPVNGLTFVKVRASLGIAED